MRSSRSVVGSLPSPCSYRKNFVSNLKSTISLRRSTIRNFRNKHPLQKSDTKYNPRIQTIRGLFTYGIWNCMRNEMMVEPTGNSEKSEPQMGFEPTTLRDLGGSWVRIPSGARIFSSSQLVLPSFHFSCVYIWHLFKKKKKKKKKRHRRRTNKGKETTMNKYVAP